MKLLLENWRKCVVAVLGILLLGVVCSPEHPVEEIPSEIAPEPTLKKVRSGETIYHRYCTPCHGTNGKGNRGSAADFVNDKERMSKSDKELLNSIREGFQGKIGFMPSWKNRLSEEEMAAVLKYIRETFSGPSK
jgi:mono/diheme cytochrome c family protein